MIYVFGILGFIGGFALGQMVLYFLLRQYSREELLNDKNLRWTYGILNWLIALLGSYSFVVVYQQYFIGP
jgi:hypothetical protein